MSKEEFLKAMDFRHACKVFDDTKKISKDDLEFILEVGRKSPSSFGMEPWKFLVIQNSELKQKVRPVCWDQVQITSCSDLIIILAKIEDLKVETGIPEKRFARRPMPQEKRDFYVNLYANHLKDTLSSDKNIYEWTAKQTYIAAGNMMTAAASIGIDSCPIEGFEKDKLEKVLELDTTKYQVALVLPFGYRLNEQSEQLRLNFDEVVEYIK
ncbi:NAD(P)H-dependent oxidoreductase [Malaciobacter molluscorum LMG 25693]|uniref:NAD(P)H-dependent oxidoreductase n=1 Tax=Malaciobacter molluscorum LMG 25693 TaxID=870501 RepID=A0A2G1DGT8_9BACT|nr:NAD(P)H-dependent oxidoreductase [Malaciobacter molluscorum]AXX92297.1 nitroreductase [Malaciobacter molluscorum LMG 25693]PHO17718.1 NAD(P)H-dependent oxidoreductase [Malaciobacter molluscorum LMG 25693]RXJ93543.1 NAD(P)H-dependent oxidoreductase [Malaciobacter molluscorum]